MQTTYELPTEVFSQNFTSGKQKCLWYIKKKKDKKSRSKTILENWHQVHLTESYVKTTECF